MNTHRDPDVTIAAWLDDGPSALPSTTRQVVVGSIHVTPQRRKPLVRLPWRFPNMNAPLRVAAAAVIGVLLLGGAYYLFGGGGGPDVGDRAATPTPSPLATQDPDASAAPTAAGSGFLPAGTYSTTAFRPRITYTVPNGWRLDSDNAGLFGLSTEVVPGWIWVCLNPRAALADNSFAEGVGTNASSLAEFIGSRTDLEIIAGPQPTTTLDIDGTYLDIKGLGADAPEIGLLRGATEPPFDVGDCGTNLYGEQRVRIGFFDMPDGSTMMISINAFGEGQNLIDAGTTIVETFRFDLP